MAPSSGNPFDFGRHYKTQVSVYITNEKREELVRCLHGNSMLIDHILNNTPDMPDPHKNIYQQQKDENKRLIKELGG